VEEGHAARVLVDEREGGARDVPVGGNLEPAREPLREGGLAAAERPHQGHHVSDRQQAAQLLTEVLGGLGAGEIEHQLALRSRASE
jgi:hypothetical protein